MVDFAPIIRYNKAYNVKPYWENSMKNQLSSQILTELKDEGNASRTLTSSSFPFFYYSFYFGA